MPGRDARAARMAVDLTQAAVAAAVRLDRTWISRFELGDAPGGVILLLANSRHHRDLIPEHRVLIEGVCPVDGREALEVLAAGRPPRPAGGYDQRRACDGPPGWGRLGAWRCP